MYERASFVFAFYLNCRVLSAVVLCSPPLLSQYIILYLIFLLCTLHKTLMCNGKIILYFTVTSPAVILFFFKHIFVNQANVVLVSGFLRWEKWLVFYL